MSTKAETSSRAEMWRLECEKARAESNDLRAEVERLKGELAAKERNRLQVIYAYEALNEAGTRDAVRYMNERDRALAAERLARELLEEWEASYTIETPPRLAYKTSKFLHHDAPAPGTPERHQQAALPAVGGATPAPPGPTTSLTVGQFRSLLISGGMTAEAAEQTLRAVLGKVGDVEAPAPPVSGSPQAGEGCAMGSDCCDLDCDREDEPEPRAPTDSELAAVINTVAPIAVHPADADDDEAPLPREEPPSHDLDCDLLYGGICSELYICMAHRRWKAHAGADPRTGRTPSSPPVDPSDPTPTPGRGERG